MLEVVVLCFMVVTHSSLWGCFVVTVLYFRRVWYPDRGAHVKCPFGKVKSLNFNVWCLGTEIDAYVFGVLGHFIPGSDGFLIFCWPCFNWSCNIKAQQLHPGSHWHQCGTTRGGAAKSREHLRRNPCVAHGGQLGHGGRHPDGHSFELQPFWSCDVTWQKRKNDGCFMKTRLTEKQTMWKCNVCFSVPWCAMWINGTKGWCWGKQQATALRSSPLVRLFRPLGSWCQAQKWRSERSAVGCCRIFAPDLYIKFSRSEIMASLNGFPARKWRDMSWFMQLKHSKRNRGNVRKR